MDIHIDMIFLCKFIVWALLTVGVIGFRHLFVRFFESYSYGQMCFALLTVTLFIPLTLFTMSPFVLLGLIFCVADVVFWMFVHNKFLEEKTHVCR